MKLIYLANLRLPTEKAHGIQIMKMCETFGLTGLEVELIVPWRFNKIKESPFSYYGIKKKFKIRKLPSLDLIPLPVPYFGFLIQSTSFALAVFFYLLFKKADYIYSRDLFSLFLLSFFKKKIIYEIHYFPKHFWLYKGILKRIKGLVVITQKLKEFYQAKGIATDKILVAPDGVDLEEFEIKESQEECRRKLNLPSDKKIVLYTGHLFKWKGVQTLIDASKYLKKDILVIFVGGTKKDIENFRQKKQALNNIMIVSHKPHSEIHYWLKTADVLILPNSAQEKISRYYTSPMKMFEYMVTKKPIVASDLPSIREVLNENNAVLVKPDSPQSLAEAINQTLKNPDFSAKIARQAYQDVQKYTWQKRTKNILKFVR